ncbi:MAG: hypothetical protein LKI42_00275 [Bacteroidales bacterium]|jgi:hypothetical protein|nr:hypothetical protein [Bacteroidales bacterium]
MEDKSRMEDTGIMNLYHRGVKVESISHYYKIPKEQVKRAILRSRAIQSTSKSIMETASEAQLKFIGKVLNAGKKLSSQEIRQKFGLREGIYESWRYAERSGYYATAIAGLKTNTNMKKYEIRWSRDPEKRKLQEENEQLKAENAYLKKKAEMEKDLQEQKRTGDLKPK